MTDDPDKHKIIKMDKKIFPNSFPVNANKSLSLDSSSRSASFTRQDGASGSQVSKVQQRTPSRNKGVVSSSNYPPTNHRNYKPNFQKGNADKRGKGGQGSKGASSAPNAIATKKCEPEAGSIQSPGGKKQNLDDLWGFVFTPRENRGYGHYGLGRSHPGGHLRSHNLAGTGNVREKKDFLLANCQFLVRMGEDYTVYLADPNLLVNWDLIEYVRIRIDGEVPKCPICLDIPVAAKITKCGHIYCCACFFHYLALSDHTLRNCPICHDPVARTDLKSVSLIPQEGIQIGSEIEMQLMVRLKDSAVAYPFEKTEGWETKFCKILQVTPTALIQTVLAKEHKELDFAFRSDPVAPESCFIQEAVEELVERETALLEIQANQGNDQAIPPNGILPVTLDSIISSSPTKAEAMKSKTKPRNDSVGSNSSEGLDDGSPRHVDVHGHCYFYQMSDGRNVFLHPLNMAMLWRELGSDPEKWPQVLTFKVIDVDAKSATEEVQKRMKFVRHLPKNAPFELIEVSMDGWGISPEVYADFAPQIKHREHRRQNRAKEEKIMEKKQREREAKEFNKLRNTPQISSPQEFPAFGSDFPQQELGLWNVSEELNGPSKDETAEFCIPELLSPFLPAPSSFAQIAGKAPLKKSPTFPVGSRSVWGSGAIAAGQPPVARQSDSEAEGEDYIPVPNYRASVSDAIERAMAGLDLRGSDGTTADEDQPATSAQGNKKKKNKKGKVLFATGMGPF